MKLLFTVLYTHQKRKKRKVWQDGTMSLDTESRKMLVYPLEGPRKDVSLD